MTQPTGPSGGALPPSSFGSYTLVRLLGEGAFGAVYEARKAPLDKRVALKILHREKARDGVMTARFLQEASAAAGLKHPHIVEVDDLGVVDGVPYIAMEFLDGETLASFLSREGAIDIGRVLDVMLPVLSAIASVHEAGIVHRDLKPDNIFLWRALAGRVHPKVLDFGIAKVADHGGAPSTQTGYVLGTPDYMSLEQWTGSKNATAASDQWALGAILYECLTAHRPFEADGIMAIAMRVSTAPPTPIRAYVLGVSPELEGIVLRTMARDPRERFPSMRAFAAALLPYASPSARALWSAEFERAGAPTHPATIAQQAPPFAPSLTAGSAPNYAFGSNPQQPPYAMPPPVTQASPAARKPWAIVAVVALLVVGVTGVAAVALSARARPAPVASDASVWTADRLLNINVQRLPDATATPDRGVADDDDEPTPPIDDDKLDELDELDATVAPPTRVTPRPRAPTPPQGELMPMQQAQACRSITEDSERNKCIIAALQGRATTQQELGTLASAQMADGRRVAARRTMQRYITRYPDGPMTPAFMRYLEAN